MRQGIGSDILVAELPDGNEIRTSVRESVYAAKKSEYFSLHTRGEFWVGTLLQLGLDWGRGYDQEAQYIIAKS